MVRGHRHEYAWPFCRDGYGFLLGQIPPGRQSRLRSPDVRGTAWTASRLSMVHSASWLWDVHHQGEDVLIRLPFVDVVDRSPPSDAWIHGDSQPERGPGQLRGGSIGTYP